MQGTQVRVSGEQGERDQPAPRDAAIGSCSRGRRQLTLGEPVELGDIIEQDSEVICVVQEILLEGRGEGREATVDLGESGLLGFVEARARVGHLAVVTLDQIAILRREVEVIQLRMHARYASIELGVQLHSIRVRRHQRCECLFDLLNLRRRVSRRDGVERRRDIVEQLTTPLQGHQCVLERRGGRDIRDRVDLAPMPGECLGERRQIVLRTDGPIVGEPVGERACGEERVRQGGVGHGLNLSPQ